MISTEERAAMAIRRRIRELGLSQPRVSRMTGRSSSWLATQVLPDPKNAIRYLMIKDPAALRRFLDALQWTPEEFSQATGIELYPELPGDTLGVQTYVIPIVDAGAGLPNWNDSEEHIEVFLPELKGLNRSDLFAVRIRGDSMEPTLHEGDIVIFARGSEAQSGRIVAVHVPDDGLIVKRLRKVQNSWLLMSDNAAYAPEPLKGRKIYGVAKALLRRI